MTDRGQLEPPAATAARDGRTRPSIRVPKDIFRIFLPLVLAIIAVSAYTYTRDSSFISGTSIETILSQSAPLGILALGQTLLLIGGELDLSVGSAVSLYGVLAAKFLLPPATPQWAITLILIGIGAGVGLFWGLLVAYIRVPTFILTLGGLSVLSSIALVLSNSTPIPTGTAYNLLGVQSWAGIKTPIVLFGILAICTGLLLRYTSFGRHIFAVGSNEQAAYLSGVPTRSVKIAMFMLSGALVAPAALVLMAQLGAGDPQMGSGLELQAIAAAVLGGATLLGGRGSIIGTVLAVVLLGAISSALVFLNIAGAYQGMVYGGVLIVAVTLSALGDRRSGRGFTERLRETLTSLIRRPPALIDGSGAGSESGRRPTPDISNSGLDPDAKSDSSIASGTSSRQVR